MIRVSRQLCLAAALALAACAGPVEDPGHQQPQRTSAVPLAGSTTGSAEGLSSAVDESPRLSAAATRGSEAAAADRPRSVESSLDSDDSLRGLPLLASTGDGAVEGTSEESAVGLAEPGDLLPNGPDEPDSLFHFVPFGANASVSPEDFASWTAWLRERFLEDPDEARQQQLDELLSQAHIIDLTPAYINLVNGLDMADPDQVARAAEFTVRWYLDQEKYKQMAINRHADDMRPLTVASRVTALKSWVRWWQRTLQNETVERYRSRVDVLTAKLERMRKERRGQL